MFTVGLFVLVLIYKQPQWVNEQSMWYIYIMGFYSAEIMNS